jgi:hypothetical protein
MKKINFLKRGIHLAVSTAILLVVGISCDIFDTESDGADSDEQLPATSILDAFPQRNAMMMSSHEVSRKQNLPASTIYNVGSGIVGNGIHGVFEPMKEIGELVWEIYDYKHTESRFDEIDEKLNNLTDQISDLDTIIKDMGKTINYKIDELTAFYASTTLNTYISPIITAMSPGSRDGFMYWSNTASDFYKDSTRNKARMDDLKEYAQEYAKSIYNSSAMPVAIQGIHDQICPPSGTGNNVLRSFAISVIDKANGVVVDTTSAMNAYKMLESYFLIVVNYQFQAATVYMNAAKMFDTKGFGLDSIYWYKDFKPKIAAEIKVFQKEVDRLVVNLAEYRNQDRFVHDMQYSEMGIAPDRMFYHVLARSQFVSNLLSAAIGDSYPKVSGHIFVPTLYLTDSEKPIVMRVGNLIVDTTGVSIESVLPYTTWNKITVDKEEMMQCNPAYTWSVFHFAVPNPEQDWPASPIELQLVDDPKTTEPWSSTPWVHSKPINGEVTPLFFNPADANKRSAAKTDDCHFQFGYFAGAWQWGDLYLSNSQMNSSWHKITKTEDYYFDFNGFNNDLYKNFGYFALTSVPFAATNSTYNEFTKEEGISFTHQDNKTGSLVATGKTTTAKRYYIIADGHYAKVKTGAHLPTYNGGIKAFATYNVYYGMKGADGDFITVNIGSKRKIVKELFHVGIGGMELVQHEEVTMKDDIVGKKWTSQKGKTNQGFGSVTLSKSTEYEPGIQYYYQTVDLNKAVSANVSLTTGYQFVYEGYNDLK